MIWVYRHMLCARSMGVGRGEQRAAVDGVMGSVHESAHARLPRIYIGSLLLSTAYSARSY